MDWVIRKSFYLRSMKQQKLDIPLPILRMVCQWNLMQKKIHWFKIGVNMQNPTDEDIIVYVEVENVEVRIADEIKFRNRVV